MTGAAARECAPLDRCALQIVAPRLNANRADRTVIVVTADDGFKRTTPTQLARDALDLHTAARASNAARTTTTSSSTRFAATAAT